MPHTQNICSEAFNSPPHLFGCTLTAAGQFPVQCRAVADDNPFLTDRELSVRCRWREDRQTADGQGEEEQSADSPARGFRHWR